MITTFWFQSRYQCKKNIIQKAYLDIKLQTQQLMINTYQGHLLWPNILDHSKDTYVNHVQFFA